MTKRRRKFRRITKPDPTTDAVAGELLTCHVPYEVNMLRALYRLLNSPSPSQLIRNAFIESFHLHARNLIEFFKNDKKCGVDPRRYTTTAFTIDGDFIPRTLETKINQQISHITIDRTDVEAEKLGNENRKVTFAKIEEQIERFEKSLTDDCREKWKAALKAVFVDDGYGSLTVAAVKSASGAIQSVTSYANTVSSPTRTVTALLDGAPLEEKDPSRAKS